jgi:hypothetical protein
MEGLGPSDLTRRCVFACCGGTTIAQAKHLADAVREHDGVLLQLSISSAHLDWSVRFPAEASTVMLALRVPP